MPANIQSHRWSEITGHLLMPMTRLGLGSILFYAGIVKAPYAASFGEAIANYDLLPRHAIPLVAHTLPWLEIATGLALICGIGTRSAAAASLLMFTVFSAAVVSALVRDLNIDCGCFETATGARIGIHTLAIEGSCMLASLLVLIFPRHSMIGLRLQPVRLPILIRKPAIV